MKDLKIIAGCVGGAYTIFAFMTIIAITLDAFVGWHAPVWPFQNTHDFLWLLRFIFGGSFIFGLFFASSVRTAHNEDF